MKKAYIHTFGCKVNQYDSQLIKEKYLKAGYEFCDDINSADIIIVNTCTVTAEADRQARQLLRKAAKNKVNAKIYVGGCYAKRAFDELKVVGANIELLENSPLTGASASIKSFAGRSRAFIKIQDGCDAFCSYCIVPFVRPVMWSKPESEIINEVKGLVANGYPEIVLSGVRLGKYEGGLCKLLVKLLEIRGNFRYRLSSLEIWEVDDELINIISSSNGRICDHLHLPLQSGSDKILKVMGRPYTTSEFSKRLAIIREKIPSCSITTDVIVGFPGETEKDHKDTCGYIEKSVFSRLHTFKYSQRPGTKASNMPDIVEPAEIKRRSDEISIIDERLRFNYFKANLGKQVLAVKSGSSFCLTSNYISLVLDNVPPGVFKVLISEQNGNPHGSIIA